MKTIILISCLAFPSVLLAEEPSPTPRKATPSEEPRPEVRPQVRQLLSASPSSSAVPPGAGSTSSRRTEVKDSHDRFADVEPPATPTPRPIKSSRPASGKAAAPSPTEETTLQPHRVVPDSRLNRKALLKPTPSYPAAAKSAGAAGVVAVRVVVDEQGRVSSADAVSGHRLLRKAAVAAARKARFKPTMLSGQPVKVTGTISYNFVLQ